MGNTKPRPVLITFSILAGLQILTAGTALTDVLGKDIAGLLVLVIAAVQVGMTFYVQGQVVPLQDAGAYVDIHGTMIAGPATGVEEGRKVSIVAHAD